MDNRMKKKSELKIFTDQKFELGMKKKIKGK